MAMTNLPGTHHDITDHASSSSSSSSSSNHSNLSSSLPSSKQSSLVQHAQHVVHYAPHHLAGHSLNNSTVSNLSPIYEGEVFPSPANTISPSLSHCNVDTNHVALFHHNTSTSAHPPSSSSSTAQHQHHHHSAGNDPSVSPTTSISSSNSSNTPTPTAIATASANSLFSIPRSTNNNPPCIPNVGFSVGYNPKNGAIASQSSTSSSSPYAESPSPSSHTTVSPVTKMDLFNRDLKMFDDADNDENVSNNQQLFMNALTTNSMVTAIDYLTGDTHRNDVQMQIQSDKKSSKKKSKSKSKSKSKRTHHHHVSHTHCKDTKLVNNESAAPETQHLKIETPPNFPNLAYISTANSDAKLDCDLDDDSKKPAEMDSPLNANSVDHHRHHHKRRAKKLKLSEPDDREHALSDGNHRHEKHSTHHRHHRHHARHSKGERKKRRKKKSVESGYSDSDSELSKGKIKDKIKRMSIRVPGDPNALYKHLRKSLFKKPKSSPHLHIFNEGEEDDIDAERADQHGEEKQTVRIHGASSMTTTMHSNPLYAYNSKPSHAHTAHPHYDHVNLVEYEQTTRNHGKSSSANGDDQVHHLHAMGRLNRDRLNSFPPNNIMFTFKSPHNLSSPSSSMSNTSVSNSSVIPMLKKSQSCSNLNGTQKEEETTANPNGVKLEEILLQNKAIIIHTPTQSGKDCEAASSYLDDTQYAHNCNNYNFSVLGLSGYQNKKKSNHHHNSSKSPSNAAHGDGGSESNKETVNSHKSYGYNILNGYCSTSYSSLHDDSNSNNNNNGKNNRIRINSFPPFTEPSYQHNKTSHSHHQHSVFGAHLGTEQIRIRVPSISTSSSSLLASKSPSNQTSDSNKSSPSLREILNTNRDFLKHNIVIERTPTAPQTAQEYSQQEWHYTNNRKTKVYGIQQYQAKRMETSTVSKSPPKASEEYEQFEPFYYRNHRNQTQPPPPPSSPYYYASNCNASGSGYLNTYIPAPPHPHHSPSQSQQTQHDASSIPVFKWNADELESSPNILPLSTQSLSEPNPAYFQLNIHANKKSKRKRKKISIDSPSSRQIHPAMNQQHMKAKPSKHGSIHDHEHSPSNSESKKPLRTSPKNKLEIVAPDITSCNLVDL